MVAPLVVELARLALAVYTDARAKSFGSTQLMVVDLQPGAGWTEKAVVFRGTDQWADWWEDADVDRVSRELWPGRVHDGFERAYVDARAWLLEALHGFRGRVHVTGHSLGGALAVLAGWDLSRQLAEPYQVGEIVTFAAPRPVDAEFAAAWREGGLDARTTRVVRAGDAVPLTPFAHWGFRHPGARVLRIVPGAVEEADLSLAHQWLALARAWLWHLGVPGLAIERYHSMQGYLEGLAA